MLPPPPAIAAAGKGVCGTGRPARKHDPRPARTPRQTKPEASVSDELPQGWAAAPLNQVAEINPRHPKGLEDAMPVTFVPMAGLSETKPTFQFTEERPL